MLLDSRFDDAPCEPQAVRGGPTPKVIRLWPRPQAWSRRDGIWFPIDVRVALSASGGGDASCDGGWHPELPSLLSVIPDSVRTLLERVHPSAHFALLRLVEAVPESAELVVSNPLLAVALAERVRQELPLDYEEVRALLGRRRTDLLDWLGLRPKRWIERLMRRLEAPTIPTDVLVSLAGVLAAENRAIDRILQHVRPLPGWLLAVVLDDVAYMVATPAILMEAQAVGIEGVRWKLRARPRATNPLLEALDYIAWTTIEQQRPLPRLRTLAEAAARYRRMRAGAAPWEPNDFSSFPSPPAGAATLLTVPLIAARPLRSAVELHAHGLAQTNCIVDQDRYPRGAAAGKVAFFEISWPTREGAVVATLEVGQDAHGWRSLQLRGASNASVPEWVEEGVRDWVGRFDLRAPRRPRAGGTQIALPLRGRTPPPQSGSSEERGDVLHVRS